MRMLSPGEGLFALHLRSAGIANFEREYRFHETRRFRFDFAWPAIKFAVEVEGGTRSGGRHVRGDGYERDTEKYALAMLDGWKVLRVTTAQVKSGQALEWTKQMVGI